MISTGERTCTDQQIIWDANHQPDARMPTTALFVAGGGFVVLQAVVLAACGFQVNGERDVGGVLIMGGFGLLVTIPSLAALLWRDWMTFDLAGRRYSRWRGFGPRVNRVWEGSFDVWEGSFDELAAVEIVGRYLEGRRPEESHSFDVNLVWKDASRRPFCFGEATTAAEAAQLAATLAPRLGVAVEERWVEEANSG